MPGRGQKAGRFRECRLASEICGAVSRNGGIRFDPLGMVAAEVAAVELVVTVHPTAQNHQFPFREHPGMVVLGVLRMPGIGQQDTQRAFGTPHERGRKLLPIDTLG